VHRAATRHVARWRAPKRIALRRQSAVPAAHLATFARFARLAPIPSMNHRPAAACAALAPSAASRCGRCRLARPGRLARIAMALAGTLCAAAALAGTAAPPTVELEALTSPELATRIAHGSTTVLVPIGGTEQSGPYIVLGKHNVRAQRLADEIARRLGNAVVAPVIAYVPEGSIRPPTGHMRFAGTISVPTSAFEAVLEGAARSFKQAGFRDVVFLGDHGGYQASETHVAERLDREWAHDPACRVHALLAYYKATEGPYTDALKARGFTPAQIGVHAGLADTSLALAVDPALVRADALAAARAAPTPAEGVRGDPRRASADLGQLGVQRIVESSVAAIRAAVAAPR
jgi:creatinine amidohydrolase/Fe(II)-dependent formamide hydrolase-like protein